MDVKRIAMVSEHASPLAAPGLPAAGGQNVHVDQLAAALARQGRDVTVYTRRDDPDLVGRVDSGRGYDVVHLDAGPAEPLPEDDRLQHADVFAAELRRHWGERAPDLVHAHCWTSGLAALDAAEPLGVPVVLTYHGLGSIERRHRDAADTSSDARLDVERDIGRRCAGVLATCAEETAELDAMGVPRDVVEVVPCGVDLDQFHPVGPEARRAARHRVVAAGRLLPRKGFDVAIEAMRTLPGAELVIAGGPAEDPEARRLRRVAVDAGVSGRVRMPGTVPREDMPALLRSADVVVCTPWYEPFGIVPLEAMACGVPVVASEVGGLADTVEDGVTGALVPPRDPDALAAALRRFLEDPETQRLAGQAGRLRASAHYSWDQVAAEALKHYESMA
jgi:glycosyltransferase involved in cell wall biosynthesis